MDFTCKGNLLFCHNHSFMSLNIIEGCNSILTVNNLFVNDMSVDLSMAVSFYGDIMSLTSNYLTTINAMWIV